MIKITIKIFFTLSLLLVTLDNITLYKIENFLTNLKPIAQFLLVIVFCANIFTQQSVFGQVTKQDNSTNPAQTGVKTDALPKTKPKKSSDISTTVTYNAKDSIRFDATNSIVRLYGDAEITYGAINLKAAKIEINWKENNVIAEGIEDSTGHVSGIPVFNEGADKYVSKRIKYNFKTKKGLINSVVTQQGEGFIHGDNIKKLPSNDIYVDHARYTTCNLEHPHYWIDATKIKMIPGKKFVSGPFNLVIAGVRTPLVFPLGFFPLPKKRASGIIIPAYGESQTAGFSLNQLGYYWATNDYMGMKLTSDLFSNGGFRAMLNTDYNVRYKFRGNLTLEYSKLISGFGERKTYLPYSFWIRWSHNPVSKKSGRLTANVSMGSSGFIRNNTTNNTQLTQNTFQSSVNYSKTFKNTPFNLNIAAKQDQNMITKIMNLQLPSVSFNMNQVRPFEKMLANTNKVDWLKKLNITYGFSGGSNFTNSISSVNTINGFKILNPQKADTVSLDSLKNYSKLFQNGQITGSHSIPIGTSLKIFKYFSLNPTFNYNEYWYTKQLKYTPEPANTINVDTSVGLYRLSGYSFSASLTTRVYGTIFIRSKKIEAIRHTMVPTVSYTYAPDFSDNIFQTIKNTSGQEVKMNRYQGLGGGLPNTTLSQSMSFSLNNTFEMKTRHTTDTNVTYKKVMLLDNIGVSGFYNFAADSFNLSNLNLNARTAIGNLLNINATAGVDPYYVKKDTILNELNQVTRIYNKRVNDFSWNNKKGIQFTSFGLNISTNLNPQAFKKDRKEEQKMTPEMVAFYRANPHMKYVDFSIPWSLSASYNLSYANDLIIAKKGQTAQAVNFNGNLSLTQNWKITFASGYDIKNKGIALAATNVAIVRDLHCWQMNLQWNPYAAFATYIFNINVKASSLQDLKLTKRGQRF